jgi:hypothetical protein
MHSITAFKSQNWEGQRLLDINGKIPAPACGRADLAFTYFLPISDTAVDMAKEVVISNSPEIGDGASQADCPVPRLLEHFEVCSGSGYDGGGEFAGNVRLVCGGGYEAGGG